MPWQLHSYEPSNDDSRSLLTPVAGTGTTFYVLRYKVINFTVDNNKAFVELVPLILETLRLFYRHRDAATITALTYSPHVVHSEWNLPPMTTALFLFLMDDITPFPSTRPAFIRPVKWWHSTHVDEHVWSCIIDVMLIWINNTLT